MTHPKCQMCRWWDLAVTDEDGARSPCRKLPPVADDRTGRARWPMTEDTDWCSGFDLDEQKQDEAEKCTCGNDGTSEHDLSCPQALAHLAIEQGERHERKTLEEITLILADPAVMLMEAQVDTKGRLFDITIKRPAADLARGQPVPTDAIERAARALLPFCYGAFEDQRMDEHGYRRFPAGTPTDIAYEAVRAVLDAAQEPA